MTAKMPNKRKAIWTSLIFLHEIPSRCHSDIASDLLGVPKIMAKMDKLSIALKAQSGDIRL